MPTRYKMENVREALRKRAELLFQLVVYNKHGELCALCLALRFGKGKELLLHILLKLRDSVSDAR